jgi:hypothetical protein
LKASPIGSDWGEFWRRILRFNWFGHHSLFERIPTFVVPCTTGHFASVAMICSFLPVGQKLSQKTVANCEPALTFRSRDHWRLRLLARAFHRCPNSFET